MPVKFGQTSIRFLFFRSYLITTVLIYIIFQIRKKIQILKILDDTRLNQPQCYLLLAPCAFTKKKPTVLSDKVNNGAAPNPGNTFTCT